MAKKSLFKIVPGSIVTGDSIGHLYCETIPVHPDSLSLPDRKKRYIPVHRVVMENSLGYITDPRKTEIHHKDGNPKNNALSNLELITKSKHQKKHLLKDKRWEKSKFWKKSPRTKPGQTRKVAEAFLKRLNP